MHNTGRGTTTPPNSNANISGIQLGYLGVIFSRTCPFSIIILIVSETHSRFCSEDKLNPLTFERVLCLYSSLYKKGVAGLSVML